MFQGFTEECSGFLWELSFNNERSWFLEHKAQFERVLKRPMDELGRETAEIMNRRFGDMSWSGHVSRIYRDARRLFGRGPYKERMWFTLRSAGAEPEGPCMYFEIGANLFRYGLGFHCAKSAEMELFRRAIDANPAAFRRMAEKFQKLNKYVIKGEEYKRAKGDLGPEINRWYNRKWISLERAEDFDTELLGSGLPLLLADSFTELMELYRFFTAVYGSGRENA